MVRLDMNLAGKSKVKIPDQFSQLDPTYVSRYWLVSEIISQLKLVATPKIIDIGGHGSLLPKFLKQRIDILDVMKSDEPNYIKASALNIPIDDNTYDAVVSCDVLEHIQDPDRQKFLSELLRITKNYVILLAPMSTDKNLELEKQANLFYRKLTRKDHMWLKEHIAFGLPKEEMVEKFLKSNNFTFVKFKHTSPETWKTILHLSFDAEAGRESIKDVKQAVFKLYSDQYMANDFHPNGYRTFYVISKQSNELTISLPDKTNAPHKHFSKAVLDTVIESLGPLAQNYDKTKLKLQEATHKEQIAWQNYQAVINSRGWKLLERVRKLMFWKQLNRSTKEVNA